MREESLPNKCEKCGSEKIKRSRTYRDMYFCLECKDGKKFLLTKEDIRNAAEIAQESNRIISFNGKPVKNCF